MDLWICVRVDSEDIRQGKARQGTARKRGVAAVSCEGNGAKTHLQASAPMPTQDPSHLGSCCSGARPPMVLGRTAKQPSNTASQAREQVGDKAYYYFKLQSAESFIFSRVGQSGHRGRSSRSSLIVCFATLFCFLQCVDSPRKRHIFSK